MKMDKILSFVIPSYNCEKFLDKCLTSFINEEVMDKIEVIVVNDGSTDSTQQIGESYSLKYPQVFRVISQENKGHGGALNTGLSAAGGKYVKVIDADDWVETQNLPLFVEKLEECNSDVVLTHHYTINISTGEVKKWKSYPEKFFTEYDFSQIMANWKGFDRSLTFHGITYNTKFYKENCIQLSEHVFYEDHEYATIPCCYAKTITPFDMFIYNYRIGDVAQSVSDSNQLKRCSHTEAVLNRFIDEYAGLRLDEDASGRDYYCMKAQGLLLSYVTTALLVEKDKAKGRAMGDEMVAKFEANMPKTYELAVSQYKTFRLMNRLHISKKTWERIKDSKLYNKIRKNHSFD